MLTIAPTTYLINKNNKNLVRPLGLEPRTHGLKARYIYQLSYERNLIIPLSYYV